jgi:peroxiredoxin
MKQTKNKSQIVLLIVASALFICNGLLIFQNLKLQKIVDGSNPSAMKVGDILDNIQVRNLDGNAANVDYLENNKTVLLFFKTSCGYCKSQLNYWKKLVLNANQKDYKIIAITSETDLNAIKNYSDDFGIKDWEILSVNLTDSQKTKFTVTPITVVIDKNGVVEKSWIGLWQDNNIDSIEKYFGIKFSNT